MQDVIVTAFTTFFVMIDPVGALPVFMGLTEGVTFRQKRSTAFRACLLGLIILSFFALTGEWLFRTLEIEMPAFRICGGILLFLIALEMVFEKRNDRRSETAGKMAGDTAPDAFVFPLAVPLLAGPGSITALILLLGRFSEISHASVVIFLMLLCVLAFTFLLFLFSGWLSRFLRPTMTTVLSRLFGIILAALSVQFVVDGIRHAFSL